MDKKKIALIVVVLFLLIGLGSFVFANPDQDNNLEGPGVSEDGGSGDGEVIDGTEPTATPEEENDDSATETDPITTYGNGGNGNGTGAGNNGTTGAGNDGTTGGVGNTDMSQYNDARRIIEELENRVHSMQNKDDSNAAVDYRTETDIIEMVNNLPEGTEKDELMNRLDAINKVLDDTKAPVITGINNNDVTKENVTINVTDDNDVTITATLDGEEIEFTTPLTEEGHYVVTVTDKNFNTTTVEFTIDTTPIALDWLYVLNNSGTDYKVIGDGQKLYVELVFSEEFTSIPMIQIGNAEAVEMSCHWTNWQTEKQYFKCDATITIDGSTMGLENGKEVPVKITNVLDAAENETVLTNENITETEKYGHVIYDKQAPEYEQLGIVDHVEWQDEVARAYAKLGDEVRVMIYFKELLAVNPTVKLGGKEFTATHRPDSDQNGLYAYYADIVLTEDMNLAEGIIPFEVYGYADATGNVGETLTETMVKNTQYESVTFDSILPVLEGLTDGMYTNQTISLKISDTNWDYIHVNQVGVKEFDEHREWTGLYDDGVYEFQAFDKAGNASEVITVTKDSVVPVQTQLLFHSSNANNNQLAKPGDYFGVYLTVNEELRENPTFVINGVEYQANQFYHADGVHQYSAVYEIPANTPAGEMTFTISNIVDKAGNVMADVTNENADEGVNTIVYDNVSPGPKVLGITGFFDEAENADPHYIKYGEKVRVLAYFDEKLSVAPTVKIGNKEFQSYYAVDSSDENNSSYAYYTDIKITPDLGLNDGEIQFKLYGYKDLAGNQGREYTNVDITYGDSNLDELCYDKVILDNVAPSMKVGDTVYGPDTTEVIYTNERFTADAIDELSGIDKIYANGYERPRIDVSGESSYTFTLVDKAGNESKFYVVIDKTKPTITGVEDGKQYLHEVTPVISDNNIDTITLNDESFVSGTTITADGKYTLKVTDKAGNSRTIEFRIGRIKTSIELIEPDNMVYDGTAKKFTARLVDEDGNVIDSVNITPVYIDANGDKGDAINAGTYTVRAYFYQNDQYATAYVSKNFVIEKATPTVEFTAPADMVYDGSAKQYTITVLGVNNVNITADASMVVTYKKRPENVELNYIPSEIGQYSLSVMVRESDNYKQVYDYINYEILPVATVDGIAYGDLQEAINNANGKTVKLASDLNLNKQILVSNGNNVTLDLAGHNISFALKTNFKVSGGTLNVIGKGTIKEDKPYFSPITVYGSTDSNAKNYSTVVIGKDVTLIGWSGLFIDYVSGYMASGVNVEVNGTLQSVPDVDGYDGHGIYLNGNVKNKANYPIITVNQTAKVLSGGPGIYAAGYAQWNINGAYIEGESAGIAIKSGILNMNAGTIKAYGKDDTPTEGNGNGINSSGTAIQVESNSGYAGDIEININGGSIISENSAAFYEYLADKTVTTNVKAISIIGGSFVSNETKDNFIVSDIFDTKFNQFITGGTYSTDPTRYVKNGYKVIQTADNTFTVVSE